MASRKGFATGDFDPAFPLDDKFDALRRLVDRDTYYAITGIYFHFLAATWRDGKRVGLRKAVADVTAAEVETMRRVGLIGADERLPRGPFQGWIGAAQKRRDGAAERQRRRRAGEATSNPVVKRPASTEQVPERMSRVTPRESGQAGSRGENQPTNGGTVNSTRAPATNGALDQFVRLATVVESLTGRTYALRDPDHGLGLEALELAGKFGELETIAAFHRAAVAVPVQPPTAGQVVLGASHLLTPIPGSPTIRPLTPEQAAQADARTRIRGDVEAARQRGTR